MVKGKPDKQREITGVIFLAVAVLLSVSYYIPSAATGVLGTVFLGLGRGLLGVAAYVLPALFLYGAFEFLRGEPRARSLRKLNHVFVMLMLAAALIQLFALDFNHFRTLAAGSDGALSASGSLRVIWQMSVRPESVPQLPTVWSGGILGALMAYGLSALAGKTGAAILLIAAMLVESVIVLGLSLSRMVSGTGAVVSRAAGKVNAAVSRSVDQQRRHRAEPSYDHIVDGALRRERAGVDIDGVDRSGDAARAAAHRGTAEDEDPAAAMLNTSPVTGPASPPAAESLHGAEPAVSRPAAGPALSGSEAGFFHVGDEDPNGAVAIGPETLSLLADFPAWNDPADPPAEPVRDPLLSQQPLFAFDADGSGRSPVVGDSRPDDTQFRTDDALFGVPDFLKPEAPETPCFYDIPEAGRPDPIPYADGLPHAGHSVSAARHAAYSAASDGEYRAAGSDFAEDARRATADQTVQPAEPDDGPDAEPFGRPAVQPPLLPLETVRQPAAEPAGAMRTETDRPVTLGTVQPAQPIRQTAARKAAPAAAGSGAGAVSGQPADAGGEKRPYVFPDIQLLNPDPSRLAGQNQHVVQDMARKLEETLSSFGVSAKVINITTGPSITRFELSPGPGVKVSKIVNLSDDIALSLAAIGLRIEAPIPGKSAIGIEIPNKETQTVMLRPLLESRQFKHAPGKLTVALGRDIPGAPVLCDLAKMPHLLIAGATGSGKSVCINCVLMSLLYKASPDDVKVILIDPKVVELSVYNGIPHLLAPVVTDPKKAANTLNWAVVEMDRRYNLFAEFHVRDMAAYNALARRDPEVRPMPLILVVIDELADLMMTAPGDVEDAIVRLTQKARAAGIHLIIATQRPSVDVITGLIKANIPSRVAFAVSSQVDSRTILDTGGAEKLLGKGDMLYYPQSSNKPIRSQGALVTDQEVERVLHAIREQNASQYDAAIADAMTAPAQPAQDGADGDGSEDDLLPTAVELFLDVGHASIALLQRRLKIGYPRASRLVDELEIRGWIGPFDGSKPRKMKLTREAWKMIKMGGTEPEDADASDALN